MPVHPAKADSPIDETQLGMFIVVSPLHFEKALFPIEATFEPIVIDDIPLQLENADSSIDITLHTILSYSMVAGIIISPEYCSPFEDITFAVFAFVTILYQRPLISTSPENAFVTDGIIKKSTVIKNCLIDVNKKFDYMTYKKKTWTIYFVYVF